MTSPVDATNRAVAWAVAEVIGGDFRVSRFFDEEDGREHIDIARFANRPVRGVTSYATVGLSDIRLPRRATPPLGAELVAACDSQAVGFLETVIEVAFRVLIGGRDCEPGAIFTNAMPRGLSAEMRHILLVEPFLWELPPRAFDRKSVAWLLMVPISTTEMRYARDAGTERLEDAFEEAQIDIFDPDRRSVV